MTTTLKAPYTLPHLREQGVTHIRITYAGAGDSGSTERIDLMSGDTVLEAPTDQLYDNWVRGLEGSLWEQGVIPSDGWWNNEGGYGQVMIDLLEDLITVEHTDYTTISPADGNDEDEVRLPVRWTAADRAFFVAAELQGHRKFEGTLVYRPKSEPWPDTVRVEILDNEWVGLRWTSQHADLMKGWDARIGPRIVQALKARIEKRLKTTTFEVDVEPDDVEVSLQWSLERGVLTMTYSITAQTSHDRGAQETALTDFLSSSGGQR